MGDRCPSSTACQASSGDAWRPPISDSHRGGHWFDPSIAHQVYAQVRDSKTGPIPSVGVGLSGCLGGIWEINFSLPPRGDAGCQVPDGAVRGAGVRLVAAVGCQHLVEQGDGGVAAGRGAGPQRVVPTGLERLDEWVAHPVRDVGVEAAQARHLVAEALLGEDVGDAVLGALLNGWRPGRRW
jgi:hypothetical protein